MSHTIQVGSFQLMKSLNKSTILNIIRLHGPISRVEIAKLTKLTAPTVTNIVGELLESNLVVETSLGESTGGRKPIMLQINYSAFYVIGVYAGAKKAKAVVATLDGNVIGEAEERYAPDPTVKEFLITVKHVIRQVMNTSDKQQDAFLGIGLGMHGLVDPVQGLSIFAPNLNLRNIPIKAALEQEFNLPVEVENDVRALALGESWFGQGKDQANFICIHIGTGIGAGIILNHELYYGTSFTAGEMGHTTIDVNGPKCSCGNYGCLEALAAGPAIIRAVQQALRLGKKSPLDEWTGGNVDQISGELVYRAALAGDIIAIEALADAGRYLGIGIANLINTLNPSRIILSGGVSRAGRFILEPLRATVEARALTAPSQAVSIVITDLGPDATAIGAFTIILQKLFTVEGVNEV